MQDLIVYALRAEYEDFSGGSVSLVDGEEFDVFEALEAGDGRIVLGLTARLNAEEQVSEPEAVRAYTDAQISEALKNYPAVEPVDVEDGDEPPSYADVDVTMPVGPTLSELRARASELDIPGRSSMSKEALAEAIAAKEARLAAEPQNASPAGDAGEESGDGEPAVDGTTEGSDL
jgi:hypothetical protein